MDIQIFGQADEELLNRIQNALNGNFNKDNIICLVLDMPELDIFKFSILSVVNNKEKRTLDGLLVLERMTQQFFLEDEFIPKGWRSFSIFSSENKILIETLKSSLPQLSGFRLTDDFLWLEIEKLNTEINQ